MPMMKPVITSSFFLYCINRLSRKRTKAIACLQKKDGGIDTSIPQNPTDLDATYREKAGMQNCGYVAITTEVADKKMEVLYA